MNFEKREAPPLAFEQAIEACKDEAFRLIRERFERTERLDYHNVRHTKNVVRRTEMILAAIADADPGALNEKGVRLGGLTAAWHDVVQKYAVEEETAGAFVKALRKRLTTENEKASAEEAAAFMEDLCRKTGDPALFSSEDVERVRQGIYVTIPSFDLEHRTVGYENLTPESDVVARAVALGDLGGAGMDGPDVFIDEGNAVFREDNLDIREALNHPETLSAMRKEFFRDRMLAWSKSQEDFAAGRKALLEAELDGLSERAQEAVRKLFNKFDETIAGAQERTELRKKMVFDELARDFGYDV